MKNTLYYVLLLFSIQTWCQVDYAELRKKAYEKLDIKNDYDSARYYADLLREASSSQIEHADHAILEGKINFMRDNFEEAIFSYQKALEFDSAGNLAPYAYMGLGASYKKFGGLSQAIRYYYLALDRFEKSENITLAHQTRILIAGLYKDLGEYGKAHEIYNELLTYFSDSKEDQALIYNNIGALFYETKDYTKALYYHKKAAVLSKEFGSLRSKGLYMHNIGDVYIKLGKYDSAELFLLKALPIHQELGAKRNMAKVNLLLAQLNVETKNFGRVPALLTAIDSLAVEVQEKAFLLEAYQTRINYYESLGQYQKASIYYPKLIALKDTLLNEEKIKSINNLEIKYETEKKEAELSASLAREEAQKESLMYQRYALIALGMVLILLVIISLLVYRMYRISKKEKEQVSLRMREQHHRIENNISVLASILSLAARNTENEEAKLIAKDGENRLNAMNLLHKELYWNSETIIIDFGNYMERLQSYLSGIFIKEKSVEIVTDIDKTPLDVGQAIPLSLIFNELITNAFKYGISKKKPTISISLKKQKKDVLLQVSDNGSGMSQTDGNTASFGSSLIQILVTQIGGTIAIKSNDAGTAITVSCPMKLI